MNKTDPIKSSAILNSPFSNKKKNEQELQDHPSESKQKQIL